VDLWAKEIVSPASSRRWEYLMTNPEAQMEESELVIQNQAWAEGTQRVRTCVVGKLIADH
jgi:hypothetical protein